MWNQELAKELHNPIIKNIEKHKECSSFKDNIWDTDQADKGSKFYHELIKSLLQDNYIEMYSTRNEGKSVVSERFIRTLMNKIYKYATSISKDVYIDKLDDIVNEYNNTYNSTIKMKPVDVKWSTYIDFNVENNDKDPKFKVGDHVQISNYKNIFAKYYAPNWFEEVFAIRKVKNTVPWAYVTEGLDGEEIVRTF